LGGLSESRFLFHVGRFEIACRFLPRGASREQHDDTHIVVEISSVLRRQFAKRFFFLALLESGRVQEVSSKSRGRIQHISAIRPGRTYELCHASQLVPDTDSAEPKPVDDLIRAKEKARGRLAIFA
jgi:hypothetical protein